MLIKENNFVKIILAILERNMPYKRKIYLAFGSNLGNSEENINCAIELICNQLGLILEKKSSYWYTEPMGDKNQDWYVNVIVRFSSMNMEPYHLLEKLHEIEYALGRVRIVGNQNAARTIDIDILDFEGYSLDDNKLSLPHKRMFERAFVLVPLKEIEPSYAYKNKSIDEFLAEITYTVEDNKIFQD